MSSVFPARPFDGPPRSTPPTLFENGSTCGQRDTPGMSGSHEVKNENKECADATTGCEAIDPVSKNNINSEPLDSLLTPLNLSAVRQSSSAITLENWLAETQAAQRDGSSTMPTQDSLPKNSLAEHEVANQKWIIDRRGQLVVSKSLANKLPNHWAAGPDRSMEEPIEKAQRTMVAKLASQNQQLDAFGYALRFAIDEIAPRTREVPFVAQIELYHPGAGEAYPIINIYVSRWQQDAELQRYIAYYLLRGMLRRYTAPFPDRVDIRMVDTGRGRLLVPYRASNGRGGSAEKVRHHIVTELLAKGISQPVQGGSDGENK